MKKLLISTGVLVVVVLAFVTYTNGSFPTSSESLTAAVGNSKNILCSTPVLKKICSITSGGTLTIGQMSISANGATNTKGNFLVNADQSKYTDTMDLKTKGHTITLGFSALAGGYVNYFSVKGFGKPEIEGKNLNNAGYGQGWQSTLRDMMHNLRYNPAVVGFSGYRLGKDALGAGTSVKINNAKNNLLVIQQANAPLYQGEGKGYDFTQYEALAHDNSYSDGGDKDNDNLPETGLSEENEVRSEFDYTGSYTNTTAKFGIPSVRHDFLYAYMRNPNAILQFTDPKDVDDFGMPVYIPNRRILDMSLSTPGNQTASSTDMSAMLPTYSVRVYPEQFTAVMWTDGGAWQMASSSVRGVGRTTVASCNITPSFPGYQYVSKISPYSVDSDCHADNGLVMMATDGNPDTAFAVGVYAPPEMGLNAKQTWLVDKDTMQVVSREDRRLQSIIGSTGGYTVIRALTAGLRSPLSLAAAGLTHHFEMYTSRSYILFGTPNEIKKAVENFKKSPQFAIDAAQ